MTYNWTLHIQWHNQNILDQDEAKINVGIFWLSVINTDTKRGNQWRNSTSKHPVSSAYGVKVPADITL